MIESPACSRRFRRCVVTSRLKEPVDVAHSHTALPRSSWRTRPVVGPFSGLSDLSGSGMKSRVSDFELIALRAGAFLHNFKPNLRTAGSIAMRVLSQLPGAYVKSGSAADECAACPDERKTQGNPSGAQLRHAAGR